MTILGDESLAALVGLLSEVASVALED